MRNGASSQACAHFSLSNTKPLPGRLPSSTAPPSKWSSPAAALGAWGAGSLPGPTGSSYRGSIRILGQAYDRALLFTSSTGAAFETLSSGSFAPAGTTATITLACPVPSQEQVAYSATSTTLTISNLVTRESFTFTKKP